MSGLWKVVELASGRSVINVVTQSKFNTCSRTCSFPSCVIPWIILQYLHILAQPQEYIIFNEYTPCNLVQIAIGSNMVAKNRLYTWH